MFLLYAGLVFGILCNRSLTTARKILQRLCFYRCLSVPTGGGACVVAPGGACVVALGGHAWLLWGACVVALGGMHGCSGGEQAWDTTRYRDTINERAVRILLECILVFE